MDLVENVCYTPVIEYIKNEVVRGFLVLWESVCDILLSWGRVIRGYALTNPFSFSFF